MKLTPAKPRIIMAQVEGSGTPEIVNVAFPRPSGRSNGTGSKAIREEKPVPEPMEIIGWPDEIAVESMLKKARP